ncbi:MAG: Ig-like domain-containing protein, partial [Planctomycetes bacterium]|nr:Ig-like domain-containing protein [Planctomycetota bacterium]
GGGGGGDDGGGGGGGNGSTFAVLARFPADQATAVPRTSPIYATFNRAANPATVTGTSFTISDGATTLSATVSYETCNNTARLLPNAALGQSTTYTVMLSGDIQDTNGMPLIAETFSFMTSAAADTTRPTFAGAQSAAASGATAIDVTWLAATGETGSVFYDIFISQISGCYDFTAPYQTSAADVTSHQVTDLTPNTTYFFMVRARDADGNTDLNTTEVTAKTLVSFTANIWGGFVQTRCSSCHSGVAPGGGLNMDDRDTTFASWTDTPNSSNCNPVLFYIVSGSPDTSFVYRKVNDTTPPCGDRMPQGGPFLNAAQIQALADWITQGANDN